MPAPFYVQRQEAEGLVIEASSVVSRYAVAEAAWLVRNVVSARDARTLSAHGVRLVVLGSGEMVTDLPEYAALTPALWWNRRYRGMGPTDALPVILCTEEDLLRLPGAEEGGETSVCLHELAHAVDHAHALRHEPFAVSLAQAYDQAREGLLWPDSYEMSSAGEYFVAGAGVWFGDPSPVAVARGLTTREALRAYDPALAALCHEAFGDERWRYAPPERRRGSDRRHLRGFDRASAIPFSWPERARWDAPEVALEWADSSPAASPASEDAGSLIFANRRQTPVEVAWLGFDGTPTPWFTLRSGEERLQDVYAGHVWIVRRPGGDELGRLVVPSGVHAFEVASRPLPPDDVDLRAALGRQDARLGWDPSPASASPVSDDRVWVRFTNTRAEPVQLDWRDFDGAWQPLDTVASHGELLRDAFVGHVWRVRSGTTVVGAITVGERPAWVEVR